MHIVDMHDTWYARGKHVDHFTLNSRSSKFGAFVPCWSLALALPVFLCPAAFTSMDDNSDGDREAGDFHRYCFDVDEMSEWLHLKAKIPQEFCDILRSQTV